MERTRAIDYLLQHVAMVVGQQSNQVLQEQLGIGMSQFRILMVLQKQPHLRQRQLAKHLGQTEASISRQMKLLADKGMLAIQVNSQNRREHITIPTAKGIKLTEAASDILARHHDPLYDKLSEKQQKQLQEILAAIHTWACQPEKYEACDHPYDV